MKAIDFEGDLNNYMAEYHYQPELTEHLDNIGFTSLTQSLVNEIVLWKLDRYAKIGTGLLNQLDRLATLSTGEHRQANDILIALLKIKGIDLPMASTILRFKNANVFQIIDRHAYRSIYNDDYPLYTGSPQNRKVSCYFDYIDELIRLCEQRNLTFETVDRLLYVFDKQINGKL